MNQNHPNFLTRLTPLGLAVLALNASSADLPSTPPKEVTNLAGSYSGSWTLFGHGQTGEIVRLMSRSDTMKADNPRVESGRAFVTTLDEMTFEGRPGEPMKLPGREGYELKPDGSLGDYFIETYGKTFKMLKLGDNVWGYSTPATPEELARLRFPKGASARHGVVKVTSVEHGVETNRISRLTTATWTDSSGKERTAQFISLQGLHQRKALNSSPVAGSTATDS